MSDDDLLTAGGLKKVIDFLQNKTDIIICNLIGFWGDERKENLLKIDQDHTMKDKAELFKFLEGKFPATFDYYTTLCSNWLLKRSLLASEEYILEEYCSDLDMFPLSSLFFYSQRSMTSGIIAAPIVLNRGENESWNKKGIIKKFFYKKRLWDDYYKKIVDNNASIISHAFRREVNRRRFYHFIEFLKQRLVSLLRSFGLYKKIKNIRNKINRLLY